jgi:hypothetical protein
VSRKLIENPMHGCQMGNAYPIPNAKQDQEHPMFADLQFQALGLQRSLLAGDQRLPLLRLRLLPRHQRVEVGAQAGLLGGRRLPLKLREKKHSAGRCR